MENMITLTEAAEILGISHEAVRRLCLRGTLGYVRRGGRYWLRREAVLLRSNQSLANDLKTGRAHV